MNSQKALIFFFSSYIAAPSGWIHLQKLVLPLFENVCEVSTDPVIVRLAQEVSSTLSVVDFWVG